ncbi:alpha/beta fold hydrolase [Nocardia sp. NPDC002869]|uniref:alpha/beta fold hydrolase n=1 Tax=Nocardia sp. NPDC002869 TaxID=3161032 RepID=UPI00398D17A8
MCYAAAGSGDPLVLLHGWPQSHAAWREQIGPLSDSRRVIAPDWLGWGASARDTALPCDYDSEVDRLARMLDALALDRVDLACHDYGGFLGLASPSAIRTVSGGWRSSTRGPTGHSSRATHCCSARSPPPPGTDSAGA